MSTACAPFAAPAWRADGLVSTFIPYPTVDRPAIRLSLLALLIAPLVAGCASSRPEAGTVGSSAPKAARDAVPTGLMPGEQIDHAGHRCGNPNFYVNTHPCLFPKRNVTP
ncbi:hypothetical protein [Burkholderia sp. Bp8986]|uniref:hypothetical protein n=1 Tax=Burkholderia sp. Bp8986 TaxID=2184550 RepID=UPI0021AB7381|nr:hypothetical protein [Burkholderia sp. Bp8986]